MSDSYREQRPLLCDDYSDEEFHIRSYYQKRNQPSVCIGRARTHAKGAAAVLTRWPDNCSTSVAYWWLGVTMIAVTIFVIYNSVLIFGMIPANNLKQPKYRTFNNGIKLKAQTRSVPDVYMHIIVNNDSDVQLNNYLPYFNLISTQYPSFNYNFLILLNDTLKDIPDFNDDRRNEVAFNSLWAIDNNAGKISRKHNLSVQHISLTDYLNDSPIKKFWRYLPSHIIQFLMRSVSIWEKGGIALDPVILTPESPNPNYLEKLYELLNKYRNSSSKPSESKPKVKAYSKIIKKRPNNIRDIINDLDTDHSNNISEIDLNEADSIKISVVTNTEKSLHLNPTTNYNSKKRNNTDFNSKENNITKGLDINSNENDDNIPNTANYTYTTDNILPLFIKYLFHTKPEKESITNTKSKNIFIPKTDDFVFDDINNYNGDKSIIVGRSPNKSVELNEYIDPVNISNKIDNEKEKNKFTKSNNYDNIPELTIDLKGNIIASKTPCHAFLGTIFSNVIHHTGEETLTDLIISELTLFCNGLLTSCAGINVILV